MSQKLTKRYRRTVRNEIRKQQNALLDSMMQGLFALTRVKRILVALQLVFGKKKWTKA